MQYLINSKVYSMQKVQMKYLVYCYLWYSGELSFYAIIFIKVLLFAIIF